LALSDLRLLLNQPPRKLGGSYIYLFFRPSSPAEAAANTYLWSKVWRFGTAVGLLSALDKGGLVAVTWAAAYFAAQSGNKWHVGVNLWDRHGAALNEALVSQADLGVSTIY
jgi:hypothetical protein